jgi:hypothetical protein
MPIATTAAQKFFYDLPEFGHQLPRLVQLVFLPNLSVILFRIYLNPEILGAKALDHFVQSRFQGSEFFFFLSIFRAPRAPSLPRSEFGIREF